MADKTYENIIYEKKPPIAYITLNRPEKMNALSRPLQREVKDALEDAGWKDNAIRVIVIKGAGRCFSAGFDLTETHGEPLNDAVQWRKHFLGSESFSATIFWDVFWKNPKPLIAQVHGFCLAGGCATATFCDLTVCSDDALFGYPLIRDGGPYLHAIWPWILGIKKAKELMFTGNMLGAQEAYRLGLVNKVVPKDKLEEEVNKLANTVAKVPVISNQYSKILINMAYDQMGIRQMLDRSSEMEGMCMSAGAESIPEMAEFDRLIREEGGLKAALAWRATRFAEEDAWWKDQRASGKNK